jgi:hypothetical protein
LAKKPEHVCSKRAGSTKSCDSCHKDKKTCNEVPPELETDISAILEFAVNYASTKSQIVKDSLKASLISAIEALHGNIIEIERREEDRRREETAKKLLAPEVNTPTPKKTKAAAKADAEIAQAEALKEIADQVTAMRELEEHQHPIHQRLADASERIAISLEVS